MPTNSNPPMRYKDAYLTLKNNAERLETYQDVDIDTLMDVVNESIAAYKVCQHRINAVETALTDAFASTDDNAQ